MRGEFTVFNPALTSPSEWDLILNCRKLDVGSTKTLLIELLRWRQEVNIDELVNRELPRPKFPAVKFGKDRAGHPVLYVILPRSLQNDVRISSQIQQVQ